MEQRSGNSRKMAWMTAGQQFGEDHGLQHAAALAFYSALSFAPVLMLFIWVTSMLGGDGQQRLIEQVDALAGSQAADMAKMVIENATSRPSVGRLAGLVSVGVVLFSATTVFAQLQASMNQVWGVEAATRAGIRGFFFKRVLGLLMLLVLGAVFVAAVVLTWILSALPGTNVDGLHYLWQAADLVVFLAVMVVLFAAVFKFLPDVEVETAVVWGGALMTAVFFVIGKYAIGYYLGHRGAGTAYGAAGTLVALLLWVYYSWAIVLYGAELTQVWARRSGREIVPESGARLRGDRRKTAPV